jgi:hypothetical protein
MLCSCGSGGGSSTPDKITELSIISYRGAFRVSSSDFGESTANFAAGALAYNPTNHSLFLAGHAQHNAIAEFPIPRLLDRPTLAELNVVSPRQNFRRILNEVSNPENIDRIDGMLYVDGQLIINAEEWYDADGSNRDTTLVIRDAENLGTSSIDGYYELDGAAEAGGYMAAIPPEWQADFGGEFLTGWSSNYSIASRYSIGPSLFVFDSNSLLYGTANSGPIDATAFMDFPYDSNHWIDPEYDKTGRGGASSLWNFVSRGIYGFIVPGTSTFVVLGSSGGIDSGIGYKINSNCGGFCAYDEDDNYNYYWLFDVQEIIDAANVYDIRPYSYGKLSVPFDNQGRHAILGATFDPDTGMLYLSLGEAGGISQFDYTPLIVGYQVSP